MKNQFLSIFLLLSSATCQAAVGCLDSSYHLHREHFFDNLDPSLRKSLAVVSNQQERPEDLKVWHPVNCSCPCEQYRGYYLKSRTEATGLCVVCKHRGKSTRISQQNIGTESAELRSEFALFEKD